MSRVGRIARILATGAGAALMLGALLALVMPYGTTIATNVVINEPGPIDANNSPSVARNPHRPDNLVVVQRLDRPAYSAILQTSFDGGASWAAVRLPLPAGSDRPYAPDVAFGPDGTLYVLYVNLEGVGNTPANLWLATSPDGGRSLSGPSRVAGRFTFQPRLATGTSTIVYATWLQAAEVGVFRLGTGANPVMASRSGDGGRTFSTPAPVTDPHRERVGAASPVVDGDGRLLVLYEDFKGDRRDFENLDGPPAEDPFSLVLTHSSDGGTSFSPGVEVENGIVSLHRFVVFLPPFPSLATGPGRTLYVTWADGRNGDDDTFLRRSTDGGATWSPSVRVNDNRLRDGTSQYLPRVAVAGDGRVDVAFLDRRRDRADVRTDAYLASSADGGVTFVNRRLSSRAFDSRIGPGTPHGDPDLGSSLALDSHGQETFAVWPDTRIGTVDSGRQDLASTTVRRYPVWPIVVWPVLAGLVVVMILFLASRLRRDSSAHA